MQNCAEFIARIKNFSTLSNCTPRAFGIDSRFITRLLCALLHLVFFASCARPADYNEKFLSRSTAARSPDWTGQAHVNSTALNRKIALLGCNKDLGAHASPLPSGASGYVMHERPRIKSPALMYKRRRGNITGLTVFLLYYSGKCTSRKYKMVHTIDCSTVANKNIFKIIFCFIIKLFDYEIYIFLKLHCFYGLKYNS